MLIRIVVIDVMFRLAMQLHIQIYIGYNRVYTYYKL